MGWECMQKRTKEQILKANLSKSLNKLKVKVAEKEEIWLDLLEMIVPQVIEESMPDDRVEKRVELGIRMTNKLFDAYEERWGKMV